MSRETPKDPVGLLDFVKRLLKSAERKIWLWVEDAFWEGYIPLNTAIFLMVSAVNVTVAWSC